MYKYNNKVLRGIYREEKNIFRNIWIIVRCKEKYI